jgi:raffinose/stachyose/melibiose transport system permease protein
MIDVMKERGFWIKKLIMHAFLFILLMVTILPLLWMLLNSFKTNADLLVNSIDIPKHFFFGNYINAWNLGLSNYFLNSATVSVVSVILTTLLGALTAYGLTRFDFKLKNAFFIVILGGLMISDQVALIPLFKLLQKLNIYNTYLAMIVPYVAFRLPFAVFLMRAYFISIPKEIEESAYIDGYGRFTIFWKIILPLSKPILISCAIMTLIFVWNEFLFALVFIENQAIMTIPVGLMAFKGQLRTDYAAMLAGITIASIPIMALYLGIQKQFVRGLTAGSVKG